MSNIIVLAAGEKCISIAQNAQKTASAKGKDFTLINARFLKPLDTELLASRNEKYVITLEDNALAGGLGDAVLRFYRNSGKQIYALGYKEEFIPHGKADALMHQRGLNAENLLHLIEELYARR